MYISFSLSLSLSLSLALSLFPLDIMKKTALHQDATCLLAATAGTAKVAANYAPLYKRADYTEASTWLEKCTGVHARKTNLVRQVLVYAFKNTSFLQCLAQGKSKKT